MPFPAIILFFFRLPLNVLVRTPGGVRELISGHSLGARAKFLSLNRTQSRAVTGLTGHNTLRGHFHLLGLLDIPLCREGGVKEETSAHILCECEVLGSLRHAYLGSFCWCQRISRVRAWGPSGASVNSQGSHDSTWGTNGPLIKAYVHWGREVPNPIAINQSINQSTPGGTRTLGWESLVYSIVPLSASTLNSSAISQKSHSF